MCAHRLPPMDPSLDDPNTLNEYSIVTFIESGLFAKIYEIRHKVTGHVYALKRQNIPLTIKYGYFHCLARERRAARELNGCPFILKIYNTFVQDQYLYFVMDFVNNADIWTHVANVRAFRPDVTQFYSAELIVALSYLREKQWIHRDLKLPNLLLDKYWHLKLADFGVAKKIGDPPGNPRDPRPSTDVGTPAFKAPEVILQHPTTFSTDLWGLAVCIYEMDTNQFPFPEGDDEDGEERMNALIFRGHYTPLPQRSDPLLKDLVSRLLIPDPELRLGAENLEDLKRHPFYEGIVWSMLSHLYPEPIYEQQIYNVNLDPPTPPPPAPDASVGINEPPLNFDITGRGEREMIFLRGCRGEEQNRQRLKPLPKNWRGMDDEIINTPGVKVRARNYQRLEELRFGGARPVVSPRRSRSPSPVNPLEEEAPTFVSYRGSDLFESSDASRSPHRLSPSRFPQSPSPSRSPQRISSSRFSQNLSPTRTPQHRSPMPMSPVYCRSPQQQSPSPIAAIHHESPQRQSPSPISMMHRRSRIPGTFDSMTRQPLLSSTRTSRSPSPVPQASRSPINQSRSLTEYVQNVSLSPGAHAEMVEMTPLRKSIGEHEHREENYIDDDDGNVALDVSGEEIEYAGVEVREHESPQRGQRKGCFTSCNCLPSCWQK